MHEYTADHRVWIINWSCKADMTAQSSLDNCAQSRLIVMIGNSVPNGDGRRHAELGELDVATHFDRRSADVRICM